MGKAATRPVLADTRPASELDNDALLVRLAAVRERIANTEADLADLYSVRASIFDAGRERENPVTVKALAAAAGVSDAAVIQARKARARQQP